MPDTVYKIHCNKVMQLIWYLFHNGQLKKNKDLENTFYHKNKLKQNAKLKTNLITCTLDKI